MKPNDRTRTYGGGDKSPADSTNRHLSGEQARRIEQRRVILEDGTLPHEIRRKAHERMCQLEREANE